MSWVTGRHHVLSIKHLLNELGYSEGTVLLRATRCQWSKAGHEEVKSWEWNHVHSQLAQISVQLQHHIRPSLQYFSIHKCLTSQC